VVIIHVARIQLNYTSGMGRIASCWKEVFVNAGHHFLHIGSNEVNNNAHANTWGFAARKYLNKLSIKPDIVLVHEPLGGFFISRQFKTIIYSHGIEERAWQVRSKYSFNLFSFKNKLFPTWLRFYSNNKGFKKASVILLSNTEDKNYLVKHKKINAEKITIFHNGYYSYLIDKKINDTITFLFNATWIERKGIDLMYKAFNELLVKNPSVKLIIAGTGAEKNIVLKEFNQLIHHQIKVIPSFGVDDEKQFYAEANVFVMPSYFEGQSVALTQAMAMGLCPIAANNCGQKDFIIHNQNGLLFNTGDANDFLKQLQYLINRKNEVVRMGLNAKTSVEKFTWQNVSNEIVETCISQNLNND